MNDSQKVLVSELVTLIAAAKAKSEEAKKVYLDFVLEVACPTTLMVEAAIAVAKVAIEMGDSFIAAATAATAALGGRDRISIGELAEAFPKPTAKTKTCADSTGPEHSRDCREPATDSLS